MVLVKRRQVRVPDSVLSSYLRTPEQLREQSPATLFGNEHPFEIEVGFGKGLFLLAAAAANPKTNYLGIEISKKCLSLTAGRLHRAGLRQVRLVLANARLVFAQCLAPASAQAVHVYFPDPWWKRRHRKRRLFAEAFVRDVERVLRAGGELHVWTDVPEYFRAITSSVEKWTALRALAPPEEREPSHEMDYRTHFERKMRQAGMEIFRGRYARPCDNSTRLDSPGSRSNLRNGRCVFGR